MKTAYLSTKAPVVSQARMIEQQFALPAGLGLNAFWELVRRKEIIPNMKDQPLNLLEERCSPHSLSEKAPAEEAVVSPPVSGQAWEYTSGVNKGRILRIVGLHEDLASSVPTVYFIYMEPENLSISDIPETDFLSLADQGLIRLVPVPFNPVENPTQKMQLFRDQWLHDFRIHMAHSRAVYDKAHRDAMVDSIRINRNVTSRTVREQYARFLKSGFHPDSLYPRYQQRGRKKTDKETTESVSVSIKNNLIRFLWKNYAVRNPPTLQETFHQFQITYYIPPEQAEKLTVPNADPPSSEVLTYGQFRYAFYQWYHANYREILIRTFGESEYRLHHQEVLGRNDYSPLAPGSVWFVDSTPVDYTVLYPNRRQVAGRPTLTFICDLFSRMICGYYLSFKKESTLTLYMALYQAMSDKRAWCARYGRDLKSGQWNVHYIPSCLTADNDSAYKSYLSNDLCETLNIEVINLKPHYAHLKAELENKFSQINNRIGRIPGRITSDGAHEKNACITLDELNGIIIDFILDYNKTAVIDPQPAADLVGVDLKPTPEAYWNWGLLHRGGLLRSFSPDQVRIRFLPLDSAEITENGIIFQKLRYS